MTARKYKRGKRIKSVSEFEKSTRIKGNRWFMVDFGSAVPKTLHWGFLTAWQYGLLEKFIYAGRVYEAKKIEEETKNEH